MTAWPTLAVAAASLATLAASVAGLAAGVVPGPIAVLLSTVACFAAFTPVHEAAHRNVSPRRWLNDGVGHVCALAIGGALGPYRFLHREHHRHPNDPARDPDHWCGRGPAWALPLRWATQDLAYLAFYARHWRTRPAAEIAELGAAVALGAAVVVGAAAAGPDAVRVVVLGWLLPARLALAGLAWTFAWLPHAPHVATDPFRATTLTTHPVLNVLLLGQSYHALHHLAPRVPFWRLAATWRARGDALRKRGVVDRWSDGGLIAGR